MLNSKVKKIGCVVILVICGVVLYFGMRNEEVKNFIGNMHTSVDTNVYQTTYEYLEVVDNYTQLTSTGKASINRWYLVIDANGERRDVQVPESVFKQVIKGAKIRCKLDKGVDGDLIRLDIVVTKEG